MSYITAQFGRPVAKPRPYRPKGKPLTETELAARWMALCAKEGRISKPKVKADPKKVSGQMVHRVRNGLSDTPRSAVEISLRLKVAESSIYSALVILKDEGVAEYTVEKCTTGNGSRRMWSLA